MKIAVTSTGTDLDSEVDPRFGRAKYIIIVDSEAFDFEVLDIKIQRAIEISTQLKDEIIKRRQAEEAREKLIVELQETLAKIKTLSGLLPICANCKKIRDDKGYWQQVELYIEKHTTAEFSHGICPDCKKELYPDLYPSA